MKTVLYILLGVFINLFHYNESFSAGLRDNSNSNNSNYRVSFGVQINDFYINKSENSLLKKTITSTFLVNRKIYSKKNHFIELGLGFSKRGIKQDITFINFIDTSVKQFNNIKTHELTYLDIPINYNIKISNKLIIGAGFSLNLLLDGTKRFPNIDTLGNVTIYNYDINDKNNYPSKFSYFDFIDVQYLLNIDYKPFKYNISLGGKFLYSTNQINSIEKLKNINYQLLISYRF